MRAVVDWSYGLLSKDSSCSSELSASLRVALRSRLPQPRLWDSFVLALRPPELSRRGPENVAKMTS